MSDIRNLSDAALRCRERHDWEEEFGGAAKAGRRRRSWGTARDSLCTSCGTLRLDVVDGYGRIDPSSRRYEWSKMYEAAKQFTREDCRLERMRRWRQAKKKGKVHA